MERERKEGGVEAEGEEGRQAEFESEPESFVTHFTCLIPGCDFET